jgi:hypothetical protein
MAGRKNFKVTPTGETIFSSYEYFHGDSGAGLGASHQTGWTGLIAKTLQMFASLNAQDFLESSKVGPVLMPQ